jgi:hypothetical protein
MMVVAYLMLTMLFVVYQDVDNGGWSLSRC